MRKLTARSRPPRPEPARGDGLENARPSGVTFSTRTTAASAAIQQHAADPERDERQHQRPAAAQAEGAVLDTCEQGAAPDQRPERTAAATEARVLERRHLVDRGEEDSRHGEPLPGGAEDTCGLVREETDERPHCRIAENERRRRPSDRRREVRRRDDSGKHHRGAHREPEPEKGGKRPGAVHHLHPVHQPGGHQPPGQRERRQRCRCAKGASQCAGIVRPIQAPTLSNKPGANVSERTISAVNPVWVSTRA